MTNSYLSSARLQLTDSFPGMDGIQVVHVNLADYILSGPVIPSHHTLMA